MFRDRSFRHERFFGHHWHESPFQKGDLKYVILDLLKDKPRYGYDVIRALEKKSHGFYTPSPGVVYPTLQMLDEMGYATSEEIDGKKVYTITEEGRNFLTERKNQADEVKSQMKRHWNPEYAAIIGEIMHQFKDIGQLMKQRGRRVDPEKMQRVRDIVVQACQEIKAIMEE